MYVQVEKPEENKSRAVANSVAQKKSSGKQGFGFVDCRQEFITQRRLQKIANNSTVLQAFIPKKYMEVEIRNYKENKRILNKGWDSSKIDELVNWCKSENQFNSFINNLSYQNWTLLASKFGGHELPRHVKNSWVTYQKANMEVVVYDNFNGFKGSGGTTWNTGKSSSDWSGCYIATSKKQAEGYIGEAGKETGKASMWKITLKKPLPVKVFSGGFIDQPDISGEFKAMVLKKILKIKNSEKLIKTLGGQGFAYLGPGGEGGNELVVPWDLIPDYINYERITEYDVNQFFVITGTTEL